VCHYNDSFEEDGCYNKGTTREERPLGKLKRKENQNEYLINNASQNHIAIIPLKKPKVKTKTFLTLKGII